MTEIKKNKRIVDEELLKETRLKNCACCGIGGGVDPHHVKSKKSGGPDIWENILPLCRICHIEIHKRGIDYMVNKYLHLGKLLKMMGWEKDFLGRWKNYKFKGKL